MHLVTIAGWPELRFLVAWDMAVRAKDRLAKCPTEFTDDLREQIVDTAQANGFWSVWMTVFADDPVTRNRLLHALRRKQERSKRN